MMEGVNLSKIYCKHFCKCHSVYPVQQLHDKIIKKKKLIGLEVFSTANVTYRKD
jgi:hypothetical protein